MNSRRSFLKSLAGVSAGVIGLNSFGAVNALAQSSGYKALVCIFLAGGNDGHNTVIPITPSENTAYKAIRGGLSLPDQNTPILNVTTPGGTPYALNGGLLAIHPLWGQKKLAVVANVGMLVQPTTRAQYLASSVPVPANLFSHSDQIQQMQSGMPSSSGGTGWAGRAADAVQSLNGASTFPPSISANGPALFSVGNIVQAASLIPGIGLTLSGMSAWPETAAAARKNALQQILTLDSGLSVIQAANKVRQDALALDQMLSSTGTGQAFSTQFPGTTIGNQMKQIAQIIALRGQMGLSRQVFFCSLGGFDTHGAQSWAHWDLLKRVADAMSAFYNATAEMGVADQVTAFTESDFGRTLEPNGPGTDHGWGNHYWVMGGAVKGGDLYGSYPPMALGGANDSGNRGAMIPTTSLDQYGATLAKWFGVPDAALTSVFPNLGNFALKDLGFLG